MMVMMTMCPGCVTLPPADYVECQVSLSLNQMLKHCTLHYNALHCITLVHCIVLIFKQMPMLGIWHCLHNFAEAQFLWVNLAATKQNSW